MRSTRFLVAIVLIAAGAAACKEKPKASPAPPPVGATGATGTTSVVVDAAPAADAGATAVTPPGDAGADAGAVQAADGTTPMPTVLTQYTSDLELDADATWKQWVLEPYADLAEYCATTANPKGCALATAKQVTPKTSVTTTEEQIISIVAETDAAGGVDYSIAINEGTQFYVAPHLAHRDGSKPLAFTRFDYTEGKNRQVVGFSWKDGDQERLAEVQIWDRTVVWFSPDGTMPSQ